MKAVLLSIFLAISGLNPLLAQAATKEAEKNTAEATPVEAAQIKELVMDYVTQLGSSSGFTWDVLLTSFLIILGTFVCRKFLAHWIFTGLRRLATRTKFEWDDKVLECVEKPLSVFILTFGIYIAFLKLPLEAKIDTFVTKLFSGSSVIIIFWALLRLTNVVSEILQEVSRKKGHAVGTFVPLFSKSVRAFIFVIGFALVLENFGLELGPVLGAIGIGGAAFAFAAKDTIANLYGSFALAMDRPFKVGDWIQVGNQVDGDVEEIGLRSTKVRTWPKTVMSIPNNVLANEIINNWSRMPKRRVKQVVGVTYSSSAEQMDELVQDIRKLLREDEGVEPSFILVNFTDFGSSSLDILVYYFTKSTAWLEHMNVRQRINTKIMRTVKAKGMAMAFPTQTVHFDGDVAKKWAGMELPNDHGPMSPP